MLLTLSEAGKELGKVSARTVRRLIDAGLLPVCYIGRLVRVPLQGIQDYVANNTSMNHNAHCVKLGAWKGVKPWSTGEAAPRTTGEPAPMQAARKLDALLALKTSKKRRQ